MTTATFKRYLKEKGTKHLKAAIEELLNGIAESGPIQKLTCVF